VQGPRPRVEGRSEWLIAKRPRFSRGIHRETSGVPGGRLSGQLLGHFPRLTVFLDQPEVRVLRDHRFVLACDVARHHRKTIRSRADLLPLRSRKPDALIAVHLPALTSEPGGQVAALHPFGLALVEIPAPRLVVRDALRSRAKRRLEGLGHLVHCKTSQKARLRPYTTRLSRYSASSTRMMIMRMVMMDMGVPSLPCSVAGPLGRNVLRRSIALPALTEF
jgi:hypothetical protein